MSKETAPAAIVTFERFREDEAEELVTLLSGNAWPFQVSSSPTPEKVRAWIAEGIFSGDAQELHWVVAPGGERVGALHLEELDKPTATTDFRLRVDMRGRGYGRAMARFAADHVFSAHPSVVRVDVKTRVDNVAMRRVMAASPGWVLEAYYRRSWPDAAGTYHDSVGYAILRDDWATGAVTPVTSPDE